MTPEGDKMCCWEQRGGGDGEDHEEAPNCLNYSSGGCQHESLEYLPSPSPSSLAHGCHYATEPFYSVSV